MSPVAVPKINFSLVAQPATKTRSEPCMQQKLQFRGISDVASAAFESPEERRLVLQMLSEAEEYLRKHRWCPSIKNRYIGFAVGGVVGVFLFQIDPPVRNRDSFLWVVVGDLPSAYLVVDRAVTPRAALEVYCEMMSAWVSAARRGLGQEVDVFPIGVDSTISNADLLASRVDFIRSEIIPSMEY